MLKTHLFSDFVEYRHDFSKLRNAKHGEDGAALTLVLFAYVKSKFRKTKHVKESLTIPVVATSPGPKIILLVLGKSCI